jgi:hypothetical protein
MGDLSSPEYQRISLEYIRHLVTLGVRLIQFDDIGFQYNWVIDPIMYQDIGNRRVLGGYGTSSLEYFTKTWLPSHYEVFPTGTTGWGLPFTRTGVLGLSTTSAVTQFRDYAKAKSGNLPSTLQDTFYEFHKGQFVKYVDLLKNTAKDYAGGQKVSFSCNGGSYQWFGDEDPKEYIGLGGSPFPFTQCDFFNSELSFSTTTIYSSGEPEHIWSRNRYIEAHNKVQIFNPPYFPKHLYTTNNPGDPDEVKEIRKVIAFAYGIGSWMVAPWDMYVPRLDIYPNVLGSAFRYFGKDFEYADLYRFVKANAPYIDGYEHVYDTSSPAGGSGVVFNTPTVKGAVEVKDKNGVLVGDSRVHPVKITSLWRAYAFLRAKPNNSTAPSVIHLVNYSEMPPSGVARTPYYSEVKNIDIELTNSFFGWPSNVPMTLAVRMPGSYLASVGSGYSEQTLTGILYGGKTTFTVPVSKDYALLIIAPK